MKNPIFLIVAFLLMAITSWGQGEKLSKEERKLLKKAELEQRYQETVSLLESNQFAIEATRLADRYGRQAFINPNTNFVLVDGDIGVIQLALGSGPGFNGLGGITLEGRITNFVLNPTNNLNRGISGRMTVIGTALGAVDLFFNINAEGNSTIRFSSNYGHRFQLYGFLTPLNESIIYQGMTTF